MLKEKKRFGCDDWRDTAKIAVFFAIFPYAIVFGQEQVKPAKVIRYQTAGTAKPDAFALPDHTTAEIIELVKQDYPALLKRSIANYERRVRDYTGMFHKQERIDGKLGPEQVISFKFKEKPFSVFMKWEKNAGPADRLLYVEGTGDNKMIVHPTGFLSWIKSVRQNPRSKTAMQSSLYPCDRFGFKRVLERLLTTYQLARKHGGTQAKYLGTTMVDARSCLEIEITLPKLQELRARRVVLKMDAEYLLPIVVISFDAGGNLIGRYVYKDLKFNVGLSDDHFTPERNNL